MTGNKQALQIVLNNDRDPGCTEKLAMTRAWGERYRAEATGYMRRKAWFFKREHYAIYTKMHFCIAERGDNNFAENNPWKLNREHWWYEREVLYYPDEEGLMETIEADPMDCPPASEANEWEKDAKDIVSRATLTLEHLGRGATLDDLRL
jgi:hypothetical protein